MTWWYGLIAVALGLLGFLWPARCVLVSRLEAGTVDVDLNLYAIGLRGRFSFRQDKDGRPTLSMGLCGIFHWHREHRLPNVHGRPSYLRLWSYGLAGMKGRHRPGASRRGMDDERGEAKAWVGVWARVAGILRRFAVIDGLKLRLAFGLPDAAATARLAGSVWALGSAVLSRLGKAVNCVSPPLLGVEPRFDRSGVWAKVELRARIPQGLLFFIVLQVLWATSRSRPLA